MELTRYWCVGLFLLFRLVSVPGQQFLTDEEDDEEFTPVVNHRCERGQMIIDVTTQQPFRGIIHPRDYRSGPCVAQGRGGRTTTLVLDLHVDKDDPRYCGVQLRKPSSGDVTVALAVRVHPTLELSEDKYFFLTCGKAGFRNARNETSRVTLNFYHDNKKVQELIYNQEYELRAAMTKPDDIHKLKVRSCLSFSPNTTEVPLIDANGCPLTRFLSAFHYNETSHSAQSLLSPIFKFPDTNKIYVQCDVVLCRGPCEQPPCRKPSEPLPRALPRIRNGTEDGQLMASTSAYIIHPGDPILAESLESCTEWRFPWLIGLCICLAILLLVMLIVNIFLCSSLTCTCTKTEVVDKEPSEMDDYDPYRVGWVSGSHYGSRSSLHKPGYLSGGSTLNSTARSVSNASDHYAIVHSRPGSRYSQHSSKEPLHKSSGGSILSNGHHNHYNSRI
ncbi:ZP domain-containing protein [Trichonephila clavata]|uniref:ZP domain-containing protein n=1 Tax=Trichonephila clavata TaxID=2740835 RepID=A0A8X6K6Y7_TRICU|nr:ZP domain-containing protein [Trichonephila clavata]